MNKTDPHRDFPAYLLLSAGDHYDSYVGPTLPWRFHEIEWMVEELLGSYMMPPFSFEFMKRAGIVWALRFRIKMSMVMCDRPIELLRHELERRFKILKEFHI